jgi:hypothetical protein
MEEDNSTTERKFIGVWFECCHTYGRLYKNKEGTLYRGRCPKCLRSIKVPINAESERATNRRFFRGS